MKDLTQDRIETHLFTLAAPVAISMITQVAYQLINLHFIASISTAATAGVNAAANASYVVAAFAQVLAVGSAPLIGQAVGRKDRAEANFVFNQSMTLSACFGLLTAASLLLLARPYLHSIAADGATAEAGATYIAWMSPGFALLLPMAALGSGLRSTGIVRPYAVISILTVVLNSILSPVLIAGWGTGLALGVTGAGLATSIATGTGLLLLGIYFLHSERYLRIQPALLCPHFSLWRRIFAIGSPAGVEFTLMFFSTAVVYYTIRDFGAATQAGFGIGSRVLQVIMLPGMAIGFAAGPIAAQNFGAKNDARVRETFHKAALIASSIMLVIAIVARCWPKALVGAFGDDDAAIGVAALFLQSMSWNFVAQGLVYVCTNLFQALGNTVPPLCSSGARFLFFCISAALLAQQPGLTLECVWYLMVASIALQAILNLFLLRLEFRKRLLPATS